MSYRTQLGAVLLSLLLVTSAVAVGAGTVAASEAVEEADEVYIDDDGTAVFVYEETHDDPDAEAITGEFGVETGTGLVHLLYTGDFEEFEEDTDEEFAAGMEASMTPEEFTAWGDLIVEAPEDVEEFDVDVQSEQTETSSETTADASVVVTDEAAEMVSLEARADLEATASTFTSSGSVDAAFGPAFGPEEHTEVTITETDGTFELEAAERTQVTEWERDQWESEEAATETLEAEYSAIAMGLGGTADVDLETYEFEETEEGEFVTLEYDVTFENVKEQVGEMLAMELAADQELDLDENEAQAIADRMTALDVERIHFAVTQEGGAAAVEWDVDIDNYDEVVLGFVELAESVDDLDDELADEFDDVDAVLEAMDDADAAYVAEMELSAQGEPAQVTVDLTASSKTENYAEYAEQLREHGLMEYTAETTFELTAGLVGSQIEGDFEYAAVGDGLLDETLTELIDFAEVEGDDELVEALENFQDAEFEAAKSNVDADEDGFEIRAAAAFEELDAFENVPVETDDGLSVVAINGVTENGTTTAYLTVADFADADAEKADLREYDRIGEDTEINLDGDWDREFPTIDEEDVSEYLGVDVAAATAATEADDDMPGFGALVAIAALAGALIALRRR